MRSGLRVRRPGSLVPGLAAAFGVVVAACHPVTLPAARSPAPTDGTGSFRAGAAIVDVTPPPGLSTWGHGPDAETSRGHRGRIHCRVVYLEDAAGERMVFVPCDFAAISVVLQRELAERLAARIGVGVDRLVLSATHTHGGPGNYFVNFNYHRGLSSDPSGYDEAVVDLIVDRLERGAIRAHDQAVPATLAWSTTILDRASASIPSIGVNRSLAAHCTNHRPMGALPSSCGDGAPSANAEVHGRLDLLRIDAAADHAPIALFASYPVHGTVVPHTNHFYEADLWGFAARYLEARLGRDDATFVAALANGPEGDVRPNYQTQDWDEARRIGELLGARIEAAYLATTEVETDPRIRAAFRDVPLRGAVGPLDPSAGRLCERPEFGRPAPGGSEEGRTTGIAHRASAPEGTTDPDRSGCHAPAARVAFSRAASRYYPDVAPLSAVAIGSAVVLSYPWEMTTTASLRLRERMAARLGEDTPVVLVGLANEYVQYLGTPEEFRAQHYEGASMFYGAHSLEVVTQELERLVTSLRGTGDPIVELRRIHLRRTSPDDVMPHDRRSRATRIDVDGTHATTFESHDAFVVAFTSGSPDVVVLPDAAIVRVEVRVAEGRYAPLVDELGRPVDDTHEDLVFEHLGRRRREADRYRVIWVPRTGTSPGDYRFAVRSGDGSFVAAPSMHFRGRP